MTFDKLPIQDYQHLKEERMAAKKRKPNPAFMKPVQPDSALSAVIGNKAMPRTQVTKKLWEYIKSHKLQDTKKRTMINNVRDDQTGQQTHEVGTEIRKAEIVVSNQVISNTGFESSCSTKRGELPLLPPVE
jgi:chromatin remodeling complex protein RSC6